MLRRILGAIPLSKDNLVSQILSGAGGASVLKIFNTAAAFVTAIVLARILGVKEFGIYSYVLSWVVILRFLAKFGNDQVLTRNVALYRHDQDWARVRGMLRFSVCVVGIGSVVCVAIIALAAPLLHSGEPGVQMALWLACFVLVFQALAVPLTATQHGLQQVTWAQIPTLFIVPSVFLILILGTHALWGGQVTAALTVVLRAIACFVAVMVAGVLLWRGLRRAGQPDRLPKPKYEPRAWLASALPLTIMSGSFVINFNADILMLGWWIGPEMTGLYKAATRGAELIFFTLVAINIPLGPMLARLQASAAHADLQRTLSLSVRLAMIPALALTSVFVIEPVWFLSLFGPGFTSAEAGRSLAILSLGQLVNVATGSAGLLLVMTKYETHAAWGVATGAILNVVLNVALIPSYGIVGAAVATSISTIVWNAVLVGFEVRQLGFNPTILPSRILGLPGRRVV